MTTRRRRVAVAVEPALLADTIAVVLRQVGDVEVVNLRAEPADAGPFDAAVVTIDLSGIDAEVVVRLAHGPRQAGVEVRGEHHRRTLEGVGDVLDVLDEHLPGWRAEQ